MNNKLAPEKPLSPKQQEIRDRPGRILSRARTILAEEGYSALTIDRLAKEMNCSRPPIYEHFASREDVVMGLAIEDCIQRWTLMKKAATFNGRPREKMLAIGEFINRTYPDHLKILGVLHPNSVRQKSSEKHRTTLADYEARCISVSTKVVEAAIACGDLTLPEGQPADLISYPMLCMSFGANTFESRHPYSPLQQRQFDRRLATALGVMYMLDGFGWKPLSTEFNYTATRDRVLSELNVEKVIAETEAEKQSRQ